MLLLGDLQTVFDGHDAMHTETILEALHKLDERPWADLRGKPIDARWLSKQLAKYDVSSRDIRTDDKVLKGYNAGDLHDPWSRYVAATENPLWNMRDRSTTQTNQGPPPSPQKSATSATAATSDGDGRGPGDESLAVADGGHRCNLCSQAPVPRRGGMCKACYATVYRDAVADLAAEENRP